MAERRPDRRIGARPRVRRAGSVLDINEQYNRSPAGTSPAIRPKAGRRFRRPNARLLEADPSASDTRRVRAPPGRPRAATRCLADRRPRRPPRPSRTPGFGAPLLVEGAGYGERLLCPSELPAAPRPAAAPPRREALAGRCCSSRLAPDLVLDLAVGGRSATRPGRLGHARLERRLLLASEPDGGPPLAGRCACSASRRPQPAAGLGWLEVRLLAGNSSLPAAGGAPPPRSRCT